MTAPTDNAELYDPQAHEPLTETTWDADRARAAIGAIVAETERAFAPESLWEPHPLDEDENQPPLGRVRTLYLGAAGVIWALHALERAGVVELGRNWVEVAPGLLERYREEPDFPEEGVVPSLWVGEAGILLVAHTLAPSRSLEGPLLEAVRANAANPTLELMWGSPGTMLAAQVMQARTHEPVWAEAWNTSADRLWAAWDDELWYQDLYGWRRHVLGPAHGFVGNVYVLARGDLLDAERRGELERRAVAVVARHVRRADGLAQWPATLEPPTQPGAIRTQWCHGSPGIVTSLATLAPTDSQLTELLVAGGELTWQAGPLKKGANLCHGTGGNGYAFLKLFQRTGDELWLHRARAFAMHAIEQVERTTADYGRGRHSLFTGDPGTALYLQSCIAASAAFPTLDAF
ncbi:MAG TPA: LanC-like protein [Gaiellaceae bacterium]|jgi:Lanthionine synthetase C-like protein|nr:LanC-like protein [Gaiellaceae bacterium]